MLQEDKRQQLDGIVQKMVANKESDYNIRFVVDDFKKKYGQQEQVETVAPQSSKKTGGVLGSVARFVGVDKLGIGLGRAINNMTGQPSRQLDKSMADLDKSDEIFMQVLKNPNSSKERQDRARKNLETNMQLRKQAITDYEDISTAGLSNKEVLGSAAQTALTVGTAGLTSKGLSLGAKTAQGAALGYGFDKSQQAIEDKKITLTPGAGTVVGGALPFASKLVGALAKNVTGVTTGAGKNVIQRAIDNPDAVAQAVKEYGVSPEARQTLVDRAKSAFSDFLHDRSVTYGDEINKLTSKVGFQGKKEVVNSFASEVTRFGGAVKNGKLTFTDSTLTKIDQANLKEAYGVISKWKNTSVKGLDGLRQAIGNIMDDFKVSGNTRANLILGNVKSTLTSGLSKNVPGYSKVLGDYGTKTQLVKNLQKELTMSGNAKASTQLNQIMRIFKKDPQVMNSLVKVMGKEEADRLLNDISGAILGEWIPAGRLGNATRVLTEAGAAGVLGLAAGAGPAAAAGLTGVAASSPRIVGKVARWAGKSQQKNIGTKLRAITTIGASKLP